MLRCALTDRTLFSSASPQTALVDRCAQLAAHGLDLLILREKDLPAAELLALARTLRQTLPRTTRILVASRTDIALAAPLDGVHLSSHPGELTPTQVRTLLPGATITVSCHTPADIARTLPHRPDALLFAPVFGKTVAGRTVTPAAGLQALAHAVLLADQVPVLALGGMDLDNARLCMDAGAAGIAAIRLFMTPARRNRQVPHSSRRLR